MKNGDLLTVAEHEGFNLFVTADQELRYQQNLTRRRIAILVLSTNNWSMVKARIAQIMEAIDAAEPGTLAFVNISNEQ